MLDVAATPCDTAVGRPRRRRVVCLRLVPDIGQGRWSASARHQELARQRSLHHYCHLRQRFSSAIDRKCDGLAISIAAIIIDTTSIFISTTFRNDNDNNNNNTRRGSRHATLRRLHGWASRPRVRAMRPSNPVCQLCRAPLPERLSRVSATHTPNHSSVSVATNPPGRRRILWQPFMFVYSPLPIHHQLIRAKHNNDLPNLWFSRSPHVTT